MSVSQMIDRLKHLKDEQIAMGTSQSWNDFLAKSDDLSKEMQPEYDKLQAEVDKS